MQSTNAPPSPEDAAGRQCHAPSSRDEKQAIPPSTWVADQFARLEIPLVAFVRRRLGSLEQARDVVQEAFVKLCQEKWPEIEERATAWLYLTCRNRAIDLSRREGRMHALHTNADVGLVQDQRNPKPGKQLEEDEQMAQLREHLNQLTDQQQEVLRLRLHDGLSYRQIAEVTGLTVTNVGYHLHQAIAQLRSRVSQS
jgi:RNA polymerase sigma-70 factor, ECF subfamily